MATPQQLEALGLLQLVEIELDPDEQPERVMYVWPSVRDWLSDVLPGLETDGYIEGANRPFHQAEALFYDYIVGKQVFQMPPHCMSPDSAGIWELRTYDLRFFGFFWRKGVLVITDADTKARCVKHGLYVGYRNQAVTRRNALNLDLPKYVSGSEVTDVL